MYTDATAFENPDFKGVYRCKNYIKKERAKDEQIQKQESTN